MTTMMKTTTRTHRHSLIMLTGLVLLAATTATALLAHLIR